MPDFFHRLSGGDVNEIDCYSVRSTEYTFHRWWDFLASHATNHGAMRLLFSMETSSPPLHPFHGGMQSGILGPCGAELGSDRNDRPP